MADKSLKDMLNQTHPEYDAKVSRWKRYRAMTDGIDSFEEKGAWLPKGGYEGSDTYKTRLSLTHSLPLSPAAVRRVVGQLLKSPPVRDVAGKSNTEGSVDALPQVVVDGLKAFHEDADGRGADLDELIRSQFWDALTMGASFAVVDRHATLVAASDGSDPTTEYSAPFVSKWPAEEVINWDVDRSGVLLWVVLRRETTKQSSPFAERSSHSAWRVLHRFGGTEYTERDNAVVVTNEWTHNLGIVPIAPLFARKVKEMTGAAYIDAISLADLRKLQFDSDQAMSSYLHGNPRLVIKTTRDLDEIAADASQAIKLNPEDRESAEYLTLDTSGMDVREKLVESVQKQALQASGIEPLVDHALQAREAASGAAMAWSFSRSEEPTLSALVDELDAFEVRLHEIVSRYLMPGDALVAGPNERVFSGAIHRSRQWDLLAVDRLVDLAAAASPFVPSKTWRNLVAADIATKLPGNTPPDIMATILTEINGSKPMNEDTPPQ